MEIGLGLERRSKSLPRPENLAWEMKTGVVNPRGADLNGMAVCFHLFSVAKTGSLRGRCGRCGDRSSLESTACLVSSRHGWARFAAKAPWFC